MASSKEADVFRVRPRAPWSAKGVAVFTYAILYIPLITLVLGSFLKGEPGGPKEWTLHWYQQVFSDQSILEAFTVSLMIAGFSTLISSAIGTTAALALERSRFRGKQWMDTMIHIPIVMPEIVMGLSLLIWFVLLKMTLGMFSIVLAHVTFSVSYVIMTVRSRLHGFDRTLEEAARDLGASPWQTFWKVTFPLILPGVISGALMAFTLSFDDFLITFFTSGVGSETLPVKIYSMIRFGVSPAINALSSLMLGLTAVAVLIAFRSPKPGRAG
ncbi:MAG: ABC transporter permease [Bdellovibrionales bacterium]|nr:ABC transporter permease [Bdellovibrionales bacterium]